MVKILKPTHAEQEIIEKLSNDKDVFIDRSRMYVRRTSSRVCFTVEHGDYNGTDLFGAAIGKANDKEAYGFIWFAYSKNSTGNFRIKSQNYSNEIADFNGNKLPNPSKISKDYPWIKFPMGAVYILKKNGYKIKNGLNGVLIGKIPEGGLSRSASLSLNLIYSILEVNGITEIDQFKLIDMAQELENEYIKSPCGKLDMAMIVFGKKDHAALYSQKKKSVYYVPIPENSESIELIILDTGTRRLGLQGTDYEIRKKECENIVSLYGKEYGFNDLSEITPKIYEELKEEGMPLNLSLRLKYIFEANQRFKQFIQGWRQGDFKKAGEILNLDGISLRDDYDLSSYPLEAMAYIARNDKNVYGARLSGGGRVGACIALRKKVPIEEFKENAEKSYKKSFSGLVPDISSYEFTDGVVKLRR